MGKVMTKRNEMHESFLVIQYTCGYCMVWWHTGYIGTHINGEYMNNPYWICSHLHKKNNRENNKVGQIKSLKIGSTLCVLIFLNNGSFLIFTFTVFIKMCCLDFKESYEVIT